MANARRSGSRGIDKCIIPLFANVGAMSGNILSHSGLFANRMAKILIRRSDLFDQRIEPHRREMIARIIHAHPTQNEALGEAFLALAGKPLHAI